MEERVKNLLDKHKDDKDLTSEKNYIKPGWDWSGGIGQRQAYVIGNLKG